MNAYKDMLDNGVSPITCVSMNHQNQLEQMENGAMFATLASDNASPRTSSATLGAAISVGSVAALVATSASGTTPSTGIASRWCFPRLLPLSTQEIRDQFPGGSVYYSRKAALLQRTHLLLRWLPIA
jgi:hypothetical protein